MESTYEVLETPSKGASISFIISERKGSRAYSGTKKIWILVLVCLVSRALHIEMLSSLDTTAFRNGLRRFISMRGKPKIIRSDRGSNFVSAYLQMKMKDLDLTELENHLANNQVEWIFNPPYSSHFAGCIERKIGSLRTCLEGALALSSRRLLNFDELHTLMWEAGAIVNNTPLTEVSDDPADPEPLTPAMLILFRKNSNPPDIDDFTERDMMQYGKHRYRRVQYLAEQFWVRWRREYVTTLHRRHKWKCIKSRSYTAQFRN